MMPLWIDALVFLERVTLFVLVMLSIWSVGIMIDRRRLFSRASLTDQSFSKIKSLIQTQSWSELKKECDQGNSFSLQLLLSLIQNKTKKIEKLDRAFQSELSDKKREFEKGFTVLATLGSNAPFIGLFGTVLGIIYAFAVLASSGSDTAQVMSGVSRALVATAAGLFVAIPAVIAYNYFSRKLKILIQESQSLFDYYLSFLGED